MVQANFLPQRVAVEHPDLLIAIGGGMNVEIAELSAFEEWGFQQVGLTIRIEPGSLPLLISDSTLCTSDHEVAITKTDLGRHRSEKIRPDVPSFHYFVATRGIAVGSLDG